MGMTVARVPNSGETPQPTVIPESGRGGLPEASDLLLGIEAIEDWAIFLVDPLGHVASWNRGAELIKGYKAEEIVGQHISRFYSDQDVLSGKCDRQLEVGGQGGKVVDTGWRLRKDGTAFWAETILTAFRGPDGKLLGFINMTRQNRVAPSKRQEEAASEAGLSGTRFLADATATLASTLDYQTVLKAVAALAVPTLADDCALDVADADGSICRVAEATDEPEKQRPPRHPRRFPPGPTRRSPTELIVPLRTRSKLFGAVSFNMSRSGRTYGHPEIALAEELVRAAGLAVDNALLFKSQLETAQRTAHLQKTTAALAQVHTTQQAAEVALEHARKAFGAPATTLFLLEKGGQRLRYLAAMGGEEEQPTKWGVVAFAANLPLTRSVREGNHYFFENQAQILERFSGSKSLGVSPSARALINLALWVKGKPIGSLVLAFDKARRFSEEERQFADVFAQQCAQALDRALLFERERRNSEFSAFLARAGELLASSPDPERALQQLAQLVLPRFGDWCAIELLDGDSSRPLAIAHADPEKVKWGWELRLKYPPEHCQPGGTFHAIDTGQPELYPEIPEKLLSGVAKNRAQLELLGKLGMRSAALVPLIASGRCLGAISMYWADSDKQYDQSDLEFFTELAHRAALALEKARLLRAEQIARVDAERAYAEANRSRAQLEATFHAMSDGVMVFDMEGHTVLINEAQARINGFPHAEEMNRDLPNFAQMYQLTLPDGQLLPAEQWPAFRVLRGETLSECELRAGRTDTGQRWFFAFSGAPVRDPQGKQVLAVIITRDITARKLAEEALRESEQQFRFLADNLPQIVWTATPDGHTDYYNRRWYEFTGRRSGEDGEESWRTILHPDDVRLCFDTWHRSVYSGEPYQIEYRFIDRRTSGYRWFLGRALPLCDELGRVKKWFGTCTDIQGQKETSERLTDALRARDDFLAIAGHELKTPLAAVMMQVQSLDRAAKANSPLNKLTERLEKASKAGARLDKLVTQVLDVSRIHAGRLRLEEESFELDGLLQEVAERFSEQANGARSPLSLRTESHIIGLWDGPRIDQVLSNLISNAIKYGEGQPIEVSLSVEPGEAVIQVTDHGIGIDPSQQTKIFERFERAVGMRQFGGFGLGLWISRQIVESSGGRIEVESSPGQGSTFTVRLPRRLEGVQHVVH
jgi:PAS domain S-box-containing protein